MRDQRTRVERARDLARAHLLRLQDPDGHWCAELEGDSILESEYVLACWMLGHEESRAPRILKLVQHLRKKQEAHGGWAQYPGGPPDLSASIKAYLALKLAGAAPDDPALARARTLIRSLGGPDRANSFTKIYLALLGQISWRKCPAIPPEVILAPRWFPVSVGAMSAWSRTIVVPLAVIWATRPTRRLPEWGSIRELWPAPGEAVPPRRLRVEGENAILRGLFLVLDKVLKATEAVRLRPVRKRALRRCMEWIAARTENSDGLGAIFPPIVNCLVAMKGMGYRKDHPAVKGALEELDRLEIEDGETMRIQPCKSPVWDTAIAINALRIAGIPADDPRIHLAADWLLHREVRTPGDWQVKNPHVEPGGWFFEYRNHPYPDVDDTAMVMMALQRLGRGKDVEALRRGLAWIGAMQNKDGGFGAFDRDCARRLFASVPFADHNAMMDPSTPDITARVLEMWALFGVPRHHPSVAKAVHFLEKHQTAEGTFYGRWGVNYIYGAWQVLRGLADVGEPVDSPIVVKAADWLESVQNADGGFGETIASYDDPSLKGKGPSTASQTSWAIMGLLAAGRRATTAVARAIDYLVETQTADGTWHEEPWTGTGFPRVFYLRYHLYRHYFPLMALGRFQAGE